MRVMISPVPSLKTTQEEAPPQAERDTGGVLDNNTVAPATAVDPSGATTRTRKGFVASVPAGVGGFEPCRSKSMSFGPAPNVSTSVIVDEAPVAGSEMVIL